MHQRNELSTKASEEHGELVRRHAGLVIIEQCIVARPTVSHGICFFPRKAEDPVQPWSERVEVIVLPRVHSDTRCEGRHTSGLLDQSPRHLALSVKSATQLTDVYRFGGVRITQER